MTEPVKRGPGRPRVDKTQRKRRVYKLTDPAGVSERFAFSMSPQLRADIRDVASTRGVNEADVVREWCEAGVRMHRSDVLR
jgi:hypothetical protein